MLWRSALFICFIMGVHLPVSASNKIEVLFAPIQREKTEMQLHFPSAFNDNEKALNELLYRIVLARLPEDKQSSLSFTQEGKDLIFSGSLSEIALLQANIFDIMENKLEEEELWKEKNRYLLERGENVEITTQDLETWIELASPIMIFYADFYLKWMQEYQEELAPKFPFSQTELSESEFRLMFVNYGDPHHFHNLRLTFDDCHNIAKLIKNMADLNLWELLKKLKGMKKLGRKIDPVHPMRFLGFIQSNPGLKKRMSKIRDSYFKWSKFMEGLCGRLSSEAKHNNLHKYIPGFCQVVGHHPYQIEDFVMRHDWHGLVDFLMFKN